MSQDKLTDEEGRLAALHRYQIADQGDDPVFDRITQLVQMVLDVPMVAVSLIERHRQIFKAVRGFEAEPVERRDAFGSETIRSARPMMVSDAQADSRFAQNPYVTGDPNIRAYLGVPLRTSDGYNIGSICAMDTRPRNFDMQQAAVMESFAKLVVEQMEQRQFAKQDLLTGALSRRAFQHEVERDFIRSSRYERPSALILIDVDHFRKINEAFGHAAGDEALKAVASRCMEAMRQSDSFGRIGGEEFALLLPETTAREAMQCAERIREVIEKLRFKIEDRVLSVSASFGVAALSPQIVAATQWFAAADVALYEAKRAGRNCSVLAAPPNVYGAAPGAEPVSASAIPVRLN